VNINDSTLKSSVFRKKEKLKLVVPCISDDYVVREWLVYQVQNIITPLSMRARLVKLTLTDAKKDKSSQPMYAMLLEADKDMAKRNNRDIIPDRIMPVQLDKAAYLRTTMFEFLVANTDWSVEFRHNIIIVKNAKDINPLPTAYDFDHSGMVGAPYAHPSEALKMNSVYERRYRGYCITDLTEYDPVIKEFNDKKEQIYALYTNCPYISDKYKSNTTRYLDEFYEIINNSNNFKKYFLYPCDKNGTGNVVISGLNGSNGGE
jgi:hypothetical protein